MFAAADDGFSILFSCFYSDCVFFSPPPVDGDKLVQSPVSLPVEEIHRSCHETSSRNEKYGRINQ